MFENVHVYRSVFSVFRCAFLLTYDMFFRHLADPQQKT